MYTMKILSQILICFAFLTNISAQSDNDVLMTVGDSDVTVREFRYIYEKNNGDEADYSKASLDEYLDLYKKFKLKVQEAKAMKLDTVQSLNDELAGYRQQLASSFLSDKKVLGGVIDEIHERKKTDVELHHILLKVKPTASAAKKRQAEKTIEEIKGKIKGGQSFEELAPIYSQDRGTMRKGGYLGFTTSMLPDGLYELESALYENKIGDVVGPIWSKLGCHLIKIKSTRPARGAIKVAHILIKTGNRGAKIENQAKEKADSIYTALNEGLNWYTAVAKYSQDKKTTAVKGELPIFGIATYEKTFEDAAFGLMNSDDISKPVKTKSGYHIIKLIEKLTPETKDEIKKRIKDKIKKYDRYKVSQTRLLDEIKKTSNFSENTAPLKRMAKGLTKDFFSYKWKPEITTDAAVINIGGGEVMLSDFGKYAKKSTRLRGSLDNSMPMEEAVMRIYDEFVREQLISFEEKNLEGKYPAFRSLMREYEEGILLFEATKISVWDRANQDTVGLKKFHENNKYDYRYDERVTVGTYTIQSGDEKQIKKVMKCAGKHDSEKTLKRFNKGEKPLVSYEENTVNLDSPMLSNLEVKKGAMSESMTNSMSKTTIFRKLVDVEKPRIKTLKEARGYVVADYQDELEKKWIAKLTKAYPVELNNEIYKKLIK